MVSFSKQLMIFMNDKAITFDHFHLNEKNIKFSQLASHTGSKAEETTKHLFQQFGLLLMRGNAALILSWTPFHVDGAVDGDQDSSLLFIPVNDNTYYWGQG